MNYVFEARICHPSKRTRSRFNQQQITLDRGDLLVSRFESSDSNFESIIGAIKSITAKRDREFVSFLEIRFEWSRQEMAEAQTYVVNPLRYFYNEVEDDMTEYDIEPRLDLGYKRIQCSSLVLPKLKKGGSPIKYLTNGSLVVSRLIKEELANTCADNLGFTPVIHRDQIHRDQRASAEMKRYDSCVGECLHNGNSEAEWFQVISKEACPIETETFDPFNINIFAIADQEPYLHVFPRFFNPLKGTLTYADGAFSSVGFGLKPGGLFTSFTRPLIISKRLYELISPYSFRSVTFDPFV